MAYNNLDRTLSEVLQDDLDRLKDLKAAVDALSNGINESIPEYVDSDSVSAARNIVSGINMNIESLERTITKLENALA